MVFQEERLDPEFYSTFRETTRDSEKRCAARNSGLIADTQPKSEWAYVN